MSSSSKGTSSMKNGVEVVVMSQYPPGACKLQNKKIVDHLYTYLSTWNHPIFFY